MIRTKLTDVEIRWINIVYKKGKFGGDTTKPFGIRRITQKINESRKRAGVETVSEWTVRNIIKKLKSCDVEYIIHHSNSIDKFKIKCPKCGYTWTLKK